MNNQDHKDFLDPRWRLNNLYKIKTKKSKLIIFKENSIQKKLNDERIKRIAIMKSRQMGLSTNELLVKFDKTIFNKHTTFCILAHERDALEKLFAIVRRAYENMPIAFKPRLDRGGGSKHEMSFPELDSKVYVDLESRGDTINLLHASEYAFMKNTDRFEATAEAVPVDSGEISIETTPEGINHFYDLWMNKDSAYKKFFFPWFMHHEYILDPGLPVSEWTLSEEKFALKALDKYGVIITSEQMAFRRYKMKDSKLFLQEYPEDEITCFLTSGSPYFDLVAVQERYGEIGDPFEEKEDEGLVIFKECDPAKTYVMGADTAEGDGTDFDVGEVWCIEDFEQVAELRGKWKPSDFALRLSNLGKRYQYRNTDGLMEFPLLGVERNNHGHAVLQSLDEDESILYPNLYYQKGKKKDAKMKRGWLTTNISRPIMLSALQTLVDEDTDSINSKVSLQECLSFVNKNGKPQAVTGKNDDTVIANAIALQMMIEGSNAFSFTKIGPNGVVGGQNIDQGKVTKYLQVK